MPPAKRRFLNLQMKLTGIFAALAAICAVFFIGILYFYFRGQLRQDLRQHAQDVAAIAASQVDGDAHAAMLQTRDASSPEYAAIRQGLAGILEASEGILGIYTVEQADDGQFAYLVDGSSEPYNLGEAYTEPAPALAALAGRLDGPLAEEDYSKNDTHSWLSGYAPISSSDGQPAGILVVNLDTSLSQGQEKQLLQVSVLILVLCIPGSMAAGYSLSFLVARPIVRIARTAKEIAEVDLTRLAEVARAIAEGDLTRSVTIQAQPLDYQAGDELGDLARALNQTIGSLQGVGEAFDAMGSNLRDLVGKVVDNANRVSTAAAQLTSVAHQAESATTQIAATVQQVAHGTAQQTEAVTQTAASVEQMSRAIDGVARGAQEQAHAVAKAAEVTTQINGAIRQVAENAHTVSQRAAGATQSAREGSRTVHDTLQGMDSIKDKVNASAQKVQEMGQRSEQIGDIVESIDEIASQTNLLSVNAAIETARAETQAHILTENLLNRQMITQAELLNQLMCENPTQDRSTAYWARLAEETKLDSICITDNDGVIIYSNEPDLCGWRFPDDPKAQANAFRKLIHQEGAVCQAPQRRSKDNQIFKYIGVHRRDLPGVVQVGFMAGTVAKFALQMGGFAVVASEVNKLAEQTRGAAKEISDLNRKIQQAVGEANQTIQGSVTEVDAGVRSANQAGQTLEQILAAVEGMAQQAEQSATAAQQMGRLSEALVESVDAVSAVVEENTAATEQMAANSSEVTQSIESIASVSEENSASAEEVSASAEEMSAQVEEVTTSAQSLAKMADDLLALVRRFRLEDGAWSDLTPRPPSLQEGGVSSRFS